MARTLSKMSLIFIPLLCMASSVEAKNWRYWPNIGCFEFSFERTVFFELTNEATRLSTIEGSELPAIVNTSIVPASDNELQLQHILAGSIKNSTTNTPEECIISCNATGFAYAGLQDGKRCVCMNEPPTAKTDGSNCNMACPGNANFSCGGSWTMDLHQNPAYHTTNLTYIGCFKNTFNDLDRMLFEGTYNNFRNNTPDWCVAYCTNGGYDYAGLQYGSQCICTNSGPQGTSDAGQCTYGCAGDNSIKMCGGLGYINIFHTDAHKTTIDDWGCGNTVQDTYYQKWYNDMGHCGITPGGARGGNGGNHVTPGNTPGGASGGSVTPRNHIMLTPGHGSQHIQFFSLSDQDPLPSCLNGQKMWRFNSGETNGVYQYLGSHVRYKPVLIPGEDKHPILCGGWPDAQSKRCIRYDGNTDSWAYNSTSTTTFGTNQGQSQLWDFRREYPEVGVVVAGGSGGGNGGGKEVYQSLDFGQTSTYLTDIPYGGDILYNGCLVIVDETTVFVGAGFSKLANQKNQVMHKETYFLNLKTNQWTRGPDLNNAKIHLTCSLVTHGDGTKEIVAVGGSNQVGSVGCELLNEVEIINPATNTKRFGQPCPIYLYGQSELSYGDKVIIIGGNEGSGCNQRHWNLGKNIYVYDAGNDTWTKSDVVLSGRSLSGSAMFVDDFC